MTTQISCVIPEITIHNNRAVTTSFAVASYFQKRHDDVLRKIRSVSDDCDPAWRLRNFTVCHENNELQNGKPQPYFELTRDAFALIVMGFTGKKALQWKIDYINAFNAMEAELQKPVTHCPGAGRYRILLTFENGILVSSEPVPDTKELIYPEEAVEVTRRAGFITIPYDSIGKITLQELQDLVVQAQKHHEHWNDRYTGIDEKRV